MTIWSRLSIWWWARWYAQPERLEFVVNDDPVGWIDGWRWNGRLLADFDPGEVEPYRTMRRELTKAGKIPDTKKPAVTRAL